jgi:putative peptidoglycan lipid II flippase
MFRGLVLDEPSITTRTQGLVLSTTGLIAQGLLRFATAFLIGHIAGKAELGIVASAIATATILALLWPTTTGSAASKFLARARGAGRTDHILQNTAHLRARTLQTAVVLSLTSIPVWLVIDDGTVGGAVSVAALTLTYSGYNFVRGVQFGAGQVARATAWDVASVMLGLGLLAGLLTLGVRGPALVLPLVATYGVYTLAGWPWAAQGRPEREARRELDTFVALGAVGSLASTGFLQLSQITAKLTAGNAEAGQYAAALNLATPASMLAASVSLVLFPSMAEAWGRGDVIDFHAQTDRALRALAFVMVGVFGSIVLASRLLIELIWGERYVGAADVLPILALAVLATNLGVASVNAITTRSQRGMWWTTGASLLGLMVGSLVWLLTTQSLGITGVAVGYLCGTVVIATIPTAIVWRQAKHRWAGVFGRVALALTLMVVLVLFQHTKNVSPWLDPVLVLLFLSSWILLNRDIASSLPIPRPRRRT